MAPATVNRMKSAAWGLGWMLGCVAWAFACLPVGATGSATTGSVGSTSGGFFGSAGAASSSGGDGGVPGTTSSSSSGGTATSDPPLDLPRTIQIPVEGVSGDLRGVTVGPDGTAWAVGATGTILRRAANSGWLKVPAPVQTDLGAVAAGATSTLAVGANGTLLLERNGSWTPLDAATNQPLNAVAWDAERASFFVAGGRLGGQGVVLSVDHAGSVTDLSPLNAEALFGVAVWGEYVVAVGEDGAVWLRGTGPAGMWARRAKVTSATLLAVTASPVRGLLMAGTRGTLLALTNRFETEVSLGTEGSAAVLAVASRGARALLALEDGTLRHLGDAGQAWTVPSMVGTPLFGAATREDESAWVVGAGGMVLLVR